MKAKSDLKELTQNQLAALFVENGFKALHSQQVFRSLYPKHSQPVLELGRSLTQFMEERFYTSSLELVERQVSKEDTEKFLFSLADGNTVETVAIPGARRLTLCVSSQVGCRYGCMFCVSGRNGFVRNLTAGEMVNQVLGVNKVKGHGKVTNIVFMGVGEPLDNYDHLKKAIEILLDEQGFYFAKKRIIISTCGLLPGIERLIGDRLGVRLSISLHSADDETRDRLMPVNRKYPLKELKATVHRFTEAEGVPVFFEYILIKGVNVSQEDAHRLVNYVKGLKCKINLIPYNPSSFFGWEAPREDEIAEFRRILEEAEIFYTMRRPRGLDIDAACGQLRSK